MLVYEKGMLRRAWDDIHPHLEEAGRDPSTFPLIVYHNVNIDEDRSKALREAQRYLDDYYGPYFDAERWTAAGSPERCARDMQELIELRPTLIGLRIVSYEQERQLDRFVTELLPLITRM